MPSRQLNLNISKTKLLFFPLNAVCLSFPISVRGCPMFLVSQAQRLCSHPGLLCSSHALHPIHRQILLAVTLAYIKNPSLSHYILCPHCGQVPTSHLDFCSGLWTGVPHPPWQSSLPSRQPSQAMTPLCSSPSRVCLYLIMAATLQKCCCTGSHTPPHPLLPPSSYFSFTDLLLFLSMGQDPTSGPLPGSPSSDLHTPH